MHEQPTLFGSLVICTVQRICGRLGKEHDCGDMVALQCMVSSWEVSYPFYYYPLIRICLRRLVLQSSSHSVPFNPFAYRAIQDRQKGTRF
jgi:hypothetical protein